jgi:uncharacterized RDD family membrane protein YckC
VSEEIDNAPNSDLAKESDGNVVLASRWQRLGASMLDGLIMMVACFPIMYFTGGFVGIEDGVQPTLGYSLFIAALGIVAFIIINYKLLTTKGQTVGKYAIGTKIVDLNGSLPSTNQLVTRYAVFFLPGQVPVIGPLLSTINILFIFGKEKRCVHDYAADTRVVVS